MYLLMQYGDFGTLGDVSADGTFKRNEKIYQRVRGHVMSLKDYTIDSTQQRREGDCFQMRQRMILQVMWSRLETSLSPLR